MITQIVGYIKEIVVQFGSRMAIQPSSCETIVGMYNIHIVCVCVCMRACVCA